MRRSLQRMARALGWTAVALACIATSSLYHAGLPRARSLVRVLLESMVSDAIRGRLEIGRLDALSFDHLEATDVRLLDLQGRAVIELDHLEGWFDLQALLRRRVVRFSAAHVEHARVRLHRVGPDGATISLVEAFEPSTPSTSGPGRASPVPVFVDGIRLDDVEVEGDVPGYDGLHLERLSVLGQVEVDRTLVLQIRSGRGTMTGPYPGETSIEQIAVRFDTDPGRRLEATAAVRRGEDTARATLTLSGTDDPTASPQLRLDVHTDGLRAETLAEMQIPTTQVLSGPVHGDLRLEGPVDRLSLDAYVIHASGPVRVHGSLPRGGPVTLQAWVRDFELRALVPRVPSMRVSGTAEVSIDTSPSPATTRRPTEWRIAAEPVELGGILWPGFEARGGILEEIVHLDEVRAPHLGGHLEASGRVGFDGRLDLHGTFDVRDIGADPNVARLAPGTHGAARGRVDATASAGGEALNIAAEVTFTNARQGRSSASQLVLRGRVRGALDAPVVRVDAEARGLTAGGVSFGDSTAHVDGGPSLYALRWRSAGSDVRRLDLVGSARRAAGGWDIEVPELTVDLGTGAMGGGVEHLRWTARRVDVVGLALRGHGQLVRGEAHLDDRRFPSAASLDLEGLPMDRIGPLLGPRFATLRGTGHVHASLSGPLSAPVLEARGELTGLGIGVSPGVSLRWTLAHADGRLITDARARLEDGSWIEAAGPIVVPLADLSDPERFRRSAQFDVTVRASTIALAPMVRWLRAVGKSELAGTLGFSVGLTGSLDAPALSNGTVLLDRIAWIGSSEVRSKIAFSLRDGRLNVQRAWVADARGELGLFEAGVPLSLTDRPESIDDFLRSLHDEAWYAALRIEPRRLDGWPRPLPKFLPPGLELALSVTAGAAEGAPPRADLASTLAWVGPASDAPCARTLRPVLQFGGVLEAGEGRLRLSAVTGERVVGVATARAAVPLERWLNRGTWTPPHPDLELNVRDLPLEFVPWTCERLAGTVSGRFAVDGWLSDTPRFDGRIAARNVRAVHGQTSRLDVVRPYRMEAAWASTDRRSATVRGCAVIAPEGTSATPIDACGGVEIPHEGETIVRAEVPIGWSEEAFTPSIDRERTVELAALMSDAHLEALLTGFSDIADADVIADGRLAARGAWPSLELTGGLSLHEGRARIIPLGQHLDGIEGALELHGNRIVIPNAQPLTARDGDGVLRVDGSVAVAGLVPTSATLRVGASSFPVRREGAVLATVTGTADTDYTFSPDSASGSVRLGDLSVRLPEQSAGRVEELASHRAILIVGEALALAEQTADASYPLRMRIDATAPFWVRRNDFAVQVTADLPVEYDETSLRVGGRAELRRGYFEVFGKRFEVQRGSMIFDPSAPTLDPVVDLVASHALPGRPGASVTVSANGPFSALTVDFSSTETGDQGEIIALLMSGHRSLGSEDAGANQRAASEQAASFLAGLSAGILTLGLRQQLGDLVPVIAVETGQNLGDTRIRAGFDAAALVPDFARSFVLGAYVEGFVTTRGGTSGGGAGGVGGGVTMELQFPYNLVGSGTYVPPQSFGIDVLWEP